MCGICGIVSPNRDYPLTRSRLEAMRDTLFHRGPDDGGLHLAPGVALGHRRLSIVDVDHGHQPMYSPDGRYALVYNGEIFNHPDLYADFTAKGIDYQTRSDTESLLHLLVHHGEQAVTRMRGMFAFAVWDANERRLILGRDRFGIKPLYYLHRPDGSLIFGSEIKAILAALDSAPELNRQALGDFLANHATSGDETLFAGIRRLPPGHTMVWQDGRVSIRRYWDLEYPTDDANVDTYPDETVIDEFRERFTEAVRIRLMSDVPLGVFLSGGIDSAAITATMAKLVSDPIQTFSVAFAEREANELNFARLVADAYRTEHREIIITADQFFDKLPKLIWHEDEPIAHPSSVPLYYVSELASQHVKVVLTGEGSDEMLAGYNRYRVTEFNSRLGRIYQRSLPAFLRKSLHRGIECLPMHSRFRQRASRTFLMRKPDLDSLYFDNFAVFGRSAQEELLTEDARETLRGVDPYAAYHEALDRVNGAPLVSQLLYADVQTYLHELLMKQDQMSMAASIESRVPFLDHPLGEWVAKLPQSLKLRGTTTKWVLRAAMKDHLPKPILGRRKMGFPVPFGRWLRESRKPLLDEFVTNERVYSRGLFEPGRLRMLVAEHLAGVNHSERLWALLTFEIWARVMFDREDPSSLNLSHLKTN